MVQVYHTTATDRLDHALSYLDEARRVLLDPPEQQPDSRAVALLLSYAAGLAIGLPNGVFLACLAECGIGPSEAQTTARAIVGLSETVVAFCQEARHG